MSNPARVKSIEALDAFRATLIVYLEKASRILDDARTDVVRTRTWLETDRKPHWKRAIRDKEKVLAQAEQELLTARLSGHPEAIQDRRLTVAKAKSSLAEAQAGLERVLSWLRHYEPDVEAPTLILQKLRQVIAFDMAKAIAYLESTASTLADYTDATPPSPAPVATEPNPHS